MDKNQAKKLLPIIKACAEGRIIEMSTINGWVNKDDLNSDLLISHPELFRIKPESKYRPFKDAEECWQEILKHQPFGWVKDTEANEYLNVYCISNSTSSIDLFGRMFKRCIFIDGSPYGIKMEE